MCICGVLSTRGKRGIYWSIGLLLSLRFNQPTRRAYNMYVKLSPTPCCMQHHFPFYHTQMGDFGLATKLVQDSERKRTICGTPNYIAPEILEGTAGHSYQVPAWGGVIICRIMLFHDRFDPS